MYLNVTAKYWCCTFIFLLEDLTVVVTTVICHSPVVSCPLSSTVAIHTIYTILYYCTEGLVRLHINSRWNLGNITSTIE